jgi:hypothetical protein
MIIQTLQQTGAAGVTVYHERPKRGPGLLSLVDYEAVGQSRHILRFFQSVTHCCKSKG